MQRLILCLVLFALTAGVWAAEGVYSFAKPGDTTPFFAKLKQPGYWKMLNADPYYKDYFRRLAANYSTREKALAPIYYSLREEIHKSGDRKGFEKPYNAHRVFLKDSAVLAMAYPDKPEYLVNARDAMWVICEEYSWVMSAHTGTPLDWDRTVDLGTTNTARVLAYACMLLEDRLDRDTLTMVRSEVRRRVFEPFERNTFFWNTDVNNWTAVCNGNIGIAMIYFEPETARKYIPKLTASMDRYISGFTKEGCCLEGLDYWAYGFGYFVWFADVLKRFTGGKTDLFDDERVKKVAAFPQKVMLKGGASVSYADGVRRNVISSSLTEYLRAVYPDAVRALPEENLKADYFEELFFGPARPDYSQAETGEYYLEEAQQIVFNSRAFSFACKAGTNHEPHNHNDVGSFIIADKNGQTFCDPGKAIYTRDYFTDDTRYKQFIPSSMGHSVPIINGEYQIFGGEGGMTKKGSSAVLDLTGAYKTDGLKKAERTFEWSDKGVVLRDEFEGELRV